MSTKSIETILNRAMNDADFAAQMLINPRETLASYDLTSDEVQRFESLSRADFDAFARATPEERKSLGWFNHNQSTLKVRKGGGTNHNEVVLKVRMGIKYNHNETALKVQAVAPHNKLTTSKK